MKCAYRNDFYHNEKNSYSSLLLFCHNVIHLKINYNEEYIIYSYDNNGVCYNNSIVVYLYIMGNHQG